MSFILSRKISAVFLVFAVIACTALPLSAADRKVERRVSPVYPELARRMHIGGTVLVEATISPDGKVTQARTVSGNKLLAPAAEDAIKKWKFAPGAGLAVENIDIDFEVGN